jgi:exodeoxyribonuclease V beta subunit
MKTGNPFSIFQSPLKPRMIIEASAGTGKTFTITGLLLRLLISEGLTIDRILVVTFTRMATKELKERILNQLRKSVLVIESGKSGSDPFYEELLAGIDDRDSAIRLLRDSIRNFDEANIYTIHGFCQQVLKDEALMTGAPVDIEVSQTNDMLVEAAEDYWRNFIRSNGNTESGKYLIDKLEKIAPGPSGLLENLKPALQHNLGSTEGSGNFKPLPLINDLINMRKEMAEMWEDHKEEIIDQLISSDVKRMTVNAVNGHTQKMDQFLAEGPAGNDAFGQLKYFTTSYHSGNLKKNKSILPQHTFFQLCEEYINLAGKIPWIETWLLENAVDEIRALRAQKARDSSVYTYDDLLNTVFDALENEKQGISLARKLRNKYTCTLVDEFQDTDPVQFKIFDRIYPTDIEGTYLFMIGDPKQSIYAFRGADLYSYIAARDVVPEESKYTLKKNFRSTPGLIQALNSIFKQEHGTPFLDDEISYHKIEAGRTIEEGVCRDRGQDIAPLKIFCFRDHNTKGQIKPLIFSETASQIRDLIAEGRKGERKLIESGHARNLESGDIAVLVHSHKDAETIKALLKELGIGAVTYSKEKVFDSREAERLEQLMTAVLNPLGRSAAQSAVVSGFFGIAISGMYEYLNNEKAFITLQEILQGLNEVWNNNGYYPMMRKLLFHHEGLLRVSELANSERVITNLFQLSELTAVAEMEKDLDPPALMRWFRNKIADRSVSDEEAIRLESDENLVKISTIHNSKGLEFPVVFCPTLWEGRDFHNRNKLIETYHRNEFPFEKVVNFQQIESRERVHSRHQAHFEEVAEEVRKAYVAVTRAKYECRIFWGTTDTSHLSGLGAMLKGRDSVRKSIENRLKVGKDDDLKSSDFYQIFKKLADNDPENIGLFLPETNHISSARLEPLFKENQISIRKYEGRPEIFQSKRMHSFTSLSGRHATDRHEPDYDQFLENYITYAPSRDEKLPGTPDIFQFPKGKTAGTCIHKLFEHDRFNFREGTLDPVNIRELLSDYGFDDRWAGVLNSMMMSVSRADYGELNLDKVSPDQMIREMEFYFPVKAPDSEKIKKIIRGKEHHGLDDDYGKHFIKGFIDLIVRQNDKYYILDYKSNHLGDDKAHYHPDRLREEILNSNYDIQYYLYTLALIKHLKSRDPAFDYSRLIGGVFYVFIRGVENGTDQGIYFDRPDEKLIGELDSYLNQKGEEG